MIYSVHSKRISSSWNEARTINHWYLKTKYRFNRSIRTTRNGSRMSANSKGRDISRTTNSS